jgi:hypothetical protein
VPEKMLVMTRLWVSACIKCGWTCTGRSEWWGIVREFFHGIFIHRLVRSYTWECVGCGKKPNRTFLLRSSAQAAITQHLVICDKYMVGGPTESSVESNPPGGLN